MKASLLLLLLFLNSRLSRFLFHWFLDLLLRRSLNTRVSLLFLGFGGSLSNALLSKGATLNFLGEFIPFGLALKHGVGALLLVSLGLLKHRDVLGKWPDSILEVNQVKDHVGHHGELWVVLTLGNHSELLIISLVNGEVFENLHEPNLVPVGQVAEVLEEGLLLIVRLVVVLVLLLSLVNHVLTESSGLLLGNESELLRLGHEGGKRSVTGVGRHEVVDVLLELRIPLLGTLHKPGNDSALSPPEGIVAVGVQPVLILEDLLLDNVVVVLVGIDLGGIVNEVVQCWVELSGVGNIEPVELLIDEVVFWVLLNIGLEVVAVLLLLLGQVAEEVSIILGPSFILALQHSLLTSLVVHWVR